MRQEDSILSLCTGADAAQTWTQRPKLKQQKPELFHLLHLPAATLHQICTQFILQLCCLLLLMSNKPAHLLISLVLDLEVSLVKVAETFTYGVYL